MGTLESFQIAVHVVYANAGDANNISEEQINSQIPILNNDFRGVSGGVDTRIEFCLAGINRIQSNDYANVWLDTEEFDLKSLAQEDPTQYLNVWIVNSLDGSISSNFWAYSTFPEYVGIYPLIDGIICEDNYFGNIGTAANNSPYNEGRTMTHEVGHWLSLLHVFSPEGNCSGDGSSTCAWSGDCCCDTPPQKNPRTGCSPNANSCHGDTPDEKDPIRNYMGYSRDNCMDNFTQCQSDRMNAALDLYRPNVTVSQPNDCPYFRFAEREEPIAAVPQLFDFQVYPNPFSTSTSIALNIAEESMVLIKAYDMQGKLLAVIQKAGQFPPGKYVFPFTNRGVSGTYCIRATVENISRSVIVRKQ